MKHLQIELHPQPWKSRVLVDGEPLQYVTSVKVDADASSDRTVVIIEYWPGPPGSGDDTPIVLSGYLVEDPQ